MKCREVTEQVRPDREEEQTEGPGPGERGTRESVSERAL